MRDKFTQLYRDGKIPSGTVTIGAESVYDIQLMIKTHLALLESSADDHVKEPYRLRMERLYKQLTK